MSVDTLRIIVEGEDRASGVLGHIGGALGSFGRIAGGVAVVGAAALAAGGVALAGVLADCVGEAIGAQEATAQLDAVLKSTGGAAGVTSEMANDLASSLSSVTRFGDEAILSGESMLLTFTNIGEDVFPATTEVMLDMSQALGQDLKSSAMQLGKALNDPVSGITALTRVGVTFTDAQKAMIEKMVESGDVAGAQKVILAELEKEFGGSARAAGETFAGQLDILNNALGNVKEGVGMALMPALSGLATTLGPVLLTAAQGFADFLTSTVVPAVSTAIGWIGQATSLVSDLAGALFTDHSNAEGYALWENLAGLFGTQLADSIMAPIDSVWELGMAIKDAGLQSSEAWEALSAVVGEEAATMIQTFIADIPGAVAQLRAMWEPAWQQIRMIVEGVFVAMRDIVTRVLGIVIGSVQDHAANLQGLLENAWMRARDIVVGVLDGLRQIVMAVLAQVQIFLANHGTEIRQALGNAWEQIGRIVNLALDVIRATVIPVLQAVAKFIRDHSQEIQIVMNGAWTLIRTIVETVLDVIEGLIRAVLAVIKGDWKGAWEEVKKVADTLWQGIRTIIETALNTILGIVGTNLDKIKQWFVDKFNEIVGFLRGINLGDIGRAMIQGLMDGIGAMAAALVAKAVGVVQGAIDAAKKLLGIASPSKVFRQIGVFAMQGLAQGFEESQPITIDAISEHIQAIVAELARLANEVVAPAAVHSALAFSDAVAPIFENVRDIVEGIVALAGLEGVKLPQNVPGLMRNLAVFVEELTKALSDVATRIPDLGEKAKGLAENAGPVLDIVTSATEAFKALATGSYGMDSFLDPNTYGQILWNVNGLTTFIGELAKAMGEAAKRVSTELQTAAKVFAENAGPVVGIVEDGLKAFTMLAKGDYTLDAFLDPGSYGQMVWNMAGLATFISELARQMGLAANLVSTELQGAAKDFAERAWPVLQIVGDGLTSFREMAAFDVSALPAAQKAVEAVTGFVGTVFGKLGGLKITDQLLVDAGWLAETGTSLFALLGEAIDNLGRVAKLDAQDMRAWAVEAGLGWITGLADGIRSGMGYLTEALGGVSTSLTSALTPAMATVASGLNGTPGRGAATVNNYFTINNPVIRDEQDIAALADAVSERMGARANTYARFGY